MYMEYINGISVATRVQSGQSVGKCVRSGASAALTGVRRPKLANREPPPVRRVLQEGRTGDGIGTNTRLFEERRPLC
jgi:hypothetical protein